MVDAKSGARNYKLRIIGVALVAVMLMLGGTQALASDSFLLNFENSFPISGTALDTCKLCHPGYPFDTTHRVNVFGSDFAQATLGDHTFNQALLDTDSDGDGFTNGQEINGLTFPGDPASHPAPGPTLDALSINGPSSVNEGDTASYEASAFWSDGTTTTVSPVWAATPGTAATIDSSGLLTALQVASDQAVTVSATYSGMTANQMVTVVDIPPLPAASISLNPQDGATDVPVTTVVIATLTGSGDIADIVNSSTFSLADAGSAVVSGSIDYNDSHTEATFTPLATLANATAYTATVAPATGTQPPVLASPVSSTFTTVAATPDSDGDGVGDGEDDQPQDNGRATPPCVRRSGKFLVDTYGNAGISLRNAEGVSDMHPQFNRRGRPFGFHFPDGLVRYKLRGVSHGGTVTVTVSFPSGVPHGSRIFKVDGNGFHESANAIVSGHKVTLTLTDGGEGDADGTANGEIDDPVGVAVPEATGGASNGTGGVSAAGGCSVAGSGEDWNDAFGSFGLIALVGMWLALRRRKPGIEGVEPLSPRRK
jgi:MYXO-CTERM domain-containing protein